LRITLLEPIVRHVWNSPKDGPSSTIARLRRVRLTIPCGLAIVIASATASAPGYDRLKLYSMLDVTRSARGEAAIVMPPLDLTELPEYLTRAN